MAEFTDTCPECGCEYRNYDEPIAYRKRCSVVCDVRAGMAAAEPDAAPPAIGCSGLAAVWCPVHGDCTCPRDVGLLPMDHPDCPLHAHGSFHAEPAKGGGRG